MTSTCIYYVYAYLRKSNGLPYYIGKGKNSRAYEKHGRVCIPKNKDFIVFLETNLTELGALALERRYIRWYGRKDNGTGILLNLTDGGEGVSGRLVTEEVKTKISNAMKGKVAKNKGLKQTHRPHKPRKDAGIKRSSMNRNVMDWQTGFMQKLTCIHCSKEFDKGNYKRYHGPKCKLKVPSFVSTSDGFLAL